MRRLPGILALGAAAILAGCAQAPLNAPLDPAALAANSPLGPGASAASGYNVRVQLASTSPDRVAVVLFFSGGGIRASALSYGVMQELALTPMPGGGNLLDRVQAISAVSGGCFPAAYYCLYGDRLFRDFEKTFLKQDVQGELVHRFLSLRHRWRLMSDRYARSDLAAEYYDELLFHGATYGDLLRGPATRPWLVINATDMDTFSTFSFTQQSFDEIGSDLARYPLSRAVAASSAVPGILTPITLKTYADRVPPPPPVALLPSAPTVAAQADAEPFVRLTQTPIDPRRRAYVHLVDGGLADNLGVSNLVDALAATRGWSGLMRPEANSLRHIVFIVVNAAIEPKAEWSDHPETPGLRAVASALSKSAIRRTNGVLLELVRRSVDDWNRDIATGDWRPRLHLIAVDFAQLKDPAERAIFAQVPTTFTLPPETIDRLVTVGGRILRDAPEFRNLMEEILRPPPAATVPPVPIAPANTARQRRLR
ncbi:patatin-like phospholipase family protein [Opitutus sp. ER46]|uniref:patatin-like phospholipase family protein n=1 Tax=Opitutus sp. ER46 TaxID=2161864 RepID=UPI001304CCC5|nr:patatin-like phospholipase family protein [Opitutus sp. ER46]